jgi:YYY domain-containing protein
MQQEKHSWIYDILLVAVLVVAAYLRLTGVQWGEGQHQHPDELFLSGVAENLRAHVCKDANIAIEACPPDQQRWMTIGEYFNTATSTLNPRNRGAGFYVYGNLPVTLVRVAYEALGDKAGPMKYFGRQFSALADLFTILILYFIVARLYNRKVALLAAALSSLAVMQIQQSHFFTVDLFMNPFMFAALYFAVRIAHEEEKQSEISNQRSALIWQSILFGLFLGMAAACKINAIVMAVVLPLALAIRFRNQYSAISQQSVDMENSPRTTKLITDHWSLITASLLIGGLATILAFRVFQPYAFDTLLPNQQWLDNMKEIRAQATGLADLPWNLQWARRTHLYSFTNLTVWGLGLPLGILAWTGFLVMGWRIFKQREWRHLLLWGWTVIYFVWQSLQFNATMRYQLPIYPLLAMMAAWAVFNVERLTLNVKRPLTFNLRPLTLSLGAIVLTLTAVWAFAFLNVYTRPETRMAASRWIYQNVPAPINLRYTDGTSQPLPYPVDGSIVNGAPFTTAFTAVTDGALTEILLPHLLATPAATQTVSVSLLGQPDVNPALISASITSDFAATSDPRGDAVTLTFDAPVTLMRGQTYFLQIETTGIIQLTGAAISNETDYDWNLPFRVDGYNAFGGMYRGDLNLQVYWDDNTEKLTRFIDTLNQTDYIFIPTNHQYGQITRIPERYPLTTLYYRELIGCPPEKDIIWCYRVAEPGTFTGRLGFDLVKTFESYPTLGPIVINDGAAEEAFTFYDHPKVLIFKKNTDYDTAKVVNTLASVDLTKVVHLVPKDAASYKPPKSLLLPADRLASQQAGGTWSQLFDYDWLQNKYPALGAVVWYLFIFLLGLVTYPLTRRVLPGLADKGYALSRVLGLVIFAYVPWLLGSLGVPVSRGLLGIVFAAMTLVGAWQAWVQREALRAEWKSNRRMFLITEGVFLSLFLLDLFIRLGNPDLWHPAKGGERPMDFSYFNAVLRSTTFPPYDPWFAGGYINYYYYGYVLVGMPVKLLGVVPSIAYNFILPTLFALVGTGAFTIGFNLIEGRGSKVEETRPATFDIRLLTGISATFLTLLLGNLGTIQMIWKALERMAAPEGITDGSTVFQRFVWGLDGIAKAFNGVPLPIGQGEWYWNPSRVMPPGPGNEITEFPLFTFLYSDLHAHMIIMPLALLIIGWGLSFILAMRSARSAARDSRQALLSSVVPLLFGALVIGAVYPTNTWDVFTYMPLAAITVMYGLFIAADGANRLKIPPLLWRLAVALLGAVILLGLARLFYQPYYYWFGSGYGEVDAWIGDRTPLSAYFTHWGVFLFLIFAWLVWEIREWMAVTPLSALNKLKPYSLVIELALAAFFVLLIYMLYKQAFIGLVALPMAFIAAVLLLRPDQSDAKRMTLFLIGTGLLLTIVVEFVALVGDIGRMNLVFKVYLQAWMLLSVSAAAASGWTLPAVASWRPRWRGIWQVGLTLLLSGAAFFTLSASMDKIRDRMNVEAPHTFDSMTYMATATYWDSVNMDLGQDYRATRWMQDNVQGSPVIVEANCPEYRWCTRFTIYTGLPGVVGWNWHQRQQRGFVEPLIIENRIAEINNFFNTANLVETVGFLRKYNVRYIIVGQVESIYYPGEGLLKFETYDGKFWHEVFRDGQTVIYEVNK